MAREESDREDLLREATGLVNRIELRCTWFEDSIVVGFRRNDAVSFFFGQDEVYQFDTSNRLRRGFWQGQLLKSEHGRLVELTRHRTDEQTQLLRLDLSSELAGSHLQRLESRLVMLLASLRAGEIEVVGHVSVGLADVQSLVRAWLEHRPRPIELARAPRVSG
jgi:hypothetical protein